MEQTFRDLCEERKAKDGTPGAAFVISAFGDAVAGIARERFMEIVSMNSVISRIGASLLVGLAATLPFVALEWKYSGGFPLGIPPAIFNVLFIEAAAFACLAISLFRTPRASLVPVLVPILFKVAAMIVPASSWAFMVADQMPCFLGGRGC
jgi:hypothetical protein